MKTDPEKGPLNFIKFHGNYVSFDPDTGLPIDPPEEITAQIPIYNPTPHTVKTEIIMPGGEPVKMEIPMGGGGKSAAAVRNWAAAVAAPALEMMPAEYMKSCI
jgi:hypothetical protein